jgi:UDP-N-acetylglucosamine--N-acetylmuramyl-(pentapeptide) pyrophosphoryl-undecaprenol N-acetylglucosamine transferase
VGAGGGLLVDDATLSGDWIGEHVRPLLLDIDQRREMEIAAASHGQRDADERLRVMVLDAISRTGAQSR